MNQVTGRDGVRDRRPMPDPAGCDSAEEFLGRLRELRQWAGQPSLRQLRRIGGRTHTNNGDRVDALPATTVSAVLGGQRAGKLPRLPFVEAFVTACLRYAGYGPADAAGAVQPWRAAWRVLALPAQRERPVGPVLAGQTVPTPRQLPMPVAGFAGRQRELQTLEAWWTGAAKADPPVPALLLITGPPGIGKTALAVAWAHRVADRFTDGHLHAELAGSGAAPLPPAVVLDRLIRALGLGPVPAVLADRIALYRSAVAGKRLLVLLDDAHSAAQVRPLLPGSGACTTVVTSRETLAGLVIREGARRLVLPPMTEREAAAVLKAVLEPARAVPCQGRLHWMVANAHGSPLRLRIAAEKLLREPAAVDGGGSPAGETGRL